MTEETNTKVAVMAQDIQYIKDEIKGLRAGNRERHEEILRAIENLSNRKANKWVESAMVWAIAGIVAACAALVWATVTKHLV